MIFFAWYQRDSAWSIHKQILILTFVDLPGYPDTSSPVGDSIRELVNPSCLMEPSQTTFVVLPLHVHNTTCIKSLL